MQTLLRVQHLHERPVLRLEHKQERVRGGHADDHQPHHAQSQSVLEVPEAGERQDTPDQFERQREARVQHRRRLPGRSRRVAQRLGAHRRQVEPELQLDHRERYHLTCSCLNPYWVSNSVNRPFDKTCSSCLETASSRACTAATLTRPSS